MEKLTPKSEEIAGSWVAPFILRILNRFSASQLSESIRDNVNLVTSLKENPKFLSNLKLIIPWVPFVEEGTVLKILPNLRSKPWIRWFIKNPMANKRRDLYNVFMYNSAAFKWLCLNMGKLSKYLEEEFS